MPKLTIRLMIIIPAALLLSLFSCLEDHTEERTLEIELAELDNTLRKLEAKKYDIDTIDQSLYYVVIKEGEGPVPKEGDECIISYRGFLLTGNKIEDSYDIYTSEGKWKFIYKPAHAVEGLITGIGYMNMGAQYDFYITSERAYGSTGGNNIPPYSTLLYRVTMERVIPAE